MTKRETGFKAVMGATRTGDMVLEGYTAVFGNVDRQGEVIRKGAFGSEPFEVPALFFHKLSDPVGGAKCIPDDRGVWAEITLADTQRGHDMMELHDVGGLPGLSIGYWINKASHGREGRKAVRFLDELEGFESTVCAVPVNPASRSFAKKAFGDDVDDEGMPKFFLEVPDLSLLTDHDPAATLRETGHKAGKRNSQRDMDSIQAVHDHSVTLGAGCYDAEDDSGEKALSDFEKENGDSADDEAEAESGAKAVVELEDTIDDLTSAISQAARAKFSSGSSCGCYVHSIKQGSTKDSGVAIVTAYDYSVDEPSKNYAVGWSRDGDEVTLSDDAVEVDLVTAMKPAESDDGSPSGEEDVEVALAEMELDLIGLEG